MKFLINTFIYSLLLVGYLLLYVVDVNVLLYPKQDIKPQSKVEFIYQQF